MAELKPCPFCCGEAKISPIHVYGKLQGFVPFCKNCCCELKMYASKQAAENAWNRRKGEADGEM